jgi:hypothetical protein
MRRMSVAGWMVALAAAVEKIHVVCFLCLETGVLLHILPVTTPAAAP